MDDYGEAFPYLRNVRRAFAASEHAARAILERLHAAAEKDEVQGLKIIARYPDELLLTFAGIGCYFRFAYTVNAGYIEYGQWQVAREGERVYVKVSEWKLGTEGGFGSYEKGESDKPMYIALAEIVRDVEGRCRAGRWTLTRHLVRGFDDPDTRRLEP
ncbi:MAG TPA: hypothetical protein VF746_27615 [Longimicrobium sp.]|jgi:hypothetical protein